jgi:hypothetical protein
MGTTVMAPGEVLNIEAVEMVVGRHLRIRLALSINTSEFNQRSS